MALIKCKNCSEEISDKSTKCVHCGYDTECSITHFCPECGKEYDNIKCSNCGYRRNNTKAELTAKEKSNIWPILGSIGITIAVLIYLIASECIEFLLMSEIIGFIVLIFILFFTFIFSLIVLTGNIGEFVDFMDDFHASTDRDPYKRALYKQMKKNNKK